MGDGCLNNEHFEELGGILKGKLEEHFKNQEARHGESLRNYLSIHRGCLFDNNTVKIVKLQFKIAVFCVNLLM